MLPDSAPRLVGDEISDETPIVTLLVAVACGLVAGVHHKDISFVVRVVIRVPVAVTPAVVSVSCVGIYGWLIFRLVCCIPVLWSCCCGLVCTVWRWSAVTSDYWRVPVADLEAIASSLRSVEQLVSTVEPAAAGVEGVDLVHGSQISAEVANFYAEWKQSRKTLLDNVATLAEASGKIADVVDTFDSETANALQNMANQLSGSGEG